MRLWRASVAPRANMHGPRERHRPFGTGPNMKMPAIYDTSWRVTVKRAS